MDLSGRANMDLSETARLLKQTTTSSAVTNPSPLQPPPLMMMQQAVAMQQFQFQQALLMQQVMANQQAAARAATVKSAAEMAAARAAEISKQLKGSDAEEEEEKKPAKSPTRSKSRSLSRSRSPSRSKSRSPIRYRRDRSLSRSPIRYRRDRPYSPSRSRDYFSYRSRSRRGYYRGRGDYPWNPYRRDWDRDRDRDYYPRRRSRSRSRSRSRVRRRSRTRSRSPRLRRERTPSPRYRREERRHTRSSRRSRSREVKRTPSASSRSPSASPPRNENSRSPSRKMQDSGSGAVRRGASESPVARIERRVEKESSASPIVEERVRSPDIKEDNFVSKEAKLDKDIPKHIEISRDVSVSPARSLSVSLNQSLRKDLESDDDVDVISKAKKEATGFSRAELSGDAEADHPHAALDTKMIDSRSDASSEEEANGDSKLKAMLVEKPSRDIKRGERVTKGPDFSDESEDKELDDWRDDVKPLSRERIGRKEGRRDQVREVEVEKKVSRKEFSMVVERSRTEPVQSRPNSSRSKKYAPDDSGQESEQQEYETSHAKKARSAADRKELKRQESFRYRGRSPLEDIDDLIDLKKSDRRRSLPSEDLDEREVKVPSKHLMVVDEEVDEELSPEGPNAELGSDSDLPDAPPRPILVADYKDEEREVDKVSGAHSLARDLSDQEDEEEVKVARVRSMYADDIAPVSRKGKEKSRSKDRRFDEEEKEKRKERHKKHRKKHRRDEDERDDEDEEKDDGDGRKERKRHKRRHRRTDDEERRDRKRRKHKSRAKSVSDAAEDTPRADAAKDENDESPVRKKSSSRRKRRRREPSRSPVSVSSSD